MQNIRTIYFDDGDLTVGQLASGEYVAFEPDREAIKGHGDTLLSAIADLNKKTEAAGEDREDDDRPLTGQSLQDWKWDHSRMLRAEAL